MKNETLTLAGLMAVFIAAGCSGLQKTGMAQSALDYSDSKYWMALPADKAKPVDVFYIHPTSFMTGEEFNEPVDKMLANKLTLFGLHNQAEAFAGAGNIYAPYYRQTHMKALDLPETERAKYLELSYTDVAAAFDRYLKHYNSGRPFILAAHSQGSEHLLRLLKDRFKNDSDLRSRLIAAYVIGWSVTKQDIAENRHLRMCVSPQDTGCLISYNTVGENPAKSLALKDSLVTNPLSWTLDGEPVSGEFNCGARLYIGGEFKVFPHYTGAQAKGDALVVPDSENMSSLPVPFKDFYHTYDYPFFFCNIQENAKLRTESFLNKAR